MGAEKDAVALVRVFPHQLFEVVGGLGVQPRHGLVQDPHPGLVDERADDVELLLHPVRIGLDLLVDGVFEGKESEIFLHPRLAFCGRDCKDVADEIEKFRSRQPFIEDVIVRDVADEPLCGERIVFEIDSANGHGTALEADDAGDALYRGGFTRAVGPYEAEDLPFADVEGELLHRGAEVAGIGLGQSVDVQHRGRYAPCRFAANCVNMRGGRAFCMKLFPDRTTQMIAK